MTGSAIELCDYRDDRRSSFDAVASIEMGEHVGETNFPTYVAALRRRRTSRRFGAGADDVAARPQGRPAPGRRAVHRVVHRARHAHAARRRDRGVPRGGRARGARRARPARALRPHRRRLAGELRGPPRRAHRARRRGGRPRLAALPRRRLDGLPRRPDGRRPDPRRPSRRARTACRPCGRGEIGRASTSSSSAGWSCWSSPSPWRSPRWSRGGSTGCRSSTSRGGWRSWPPPPVCALVGPLVAEPDAWRSWLLVALVAVWGGRLAWHILKRSRGHGEDPRYLKMLGGELNDGHFGDAVTQGVRRPGRRPSGWSRCRCRPPPSPTCAGPGWCGPAWSSG